MLAPESFARTHKRHVTDVVRVALERHGIIGFIETHEAMTLLEARQLIWENVENTPCDFQFVLDDGVPVSARQENTQRVLAFYPCLKIREAKKPPASPRLSTSFRDGEGVASSATEKISVWTASGDEFATWISDEYTFQQLRRDAARYWNVPASHVALTDRDGCLWPEQAKILAVMSVDQLRDRKIVLETKASPPTQTSPQPQVVPCRRRSSSVDAALSPPRRVSHAESANAMEDLWRVFTFYCVNGDSLELECIRAHQFTKLLRETGVLGAAVTPAMATIIYTSETKGKAQSSGKMNFDEFLSALVKVAGARHRKSSTKLLQRATETDAREQDEAFQRLVAECILPRASRWPTQRWELQTQELRTPEIVAFVSKFLDPLLDLYAFYAKNHLLNPTTGIKEFYMAYADYQRFINDFAMANLQISSVEAAQVFVAACSSAPFHEALSGSDVVATLSSRSLDLDDTVSNTSSLTGAAAMAVAFQKAMHAGEGAVLYLPAAAQIGRLCMSFSAFLDGLGRLGLVAFAKTKRGKLLRALQSVKAVFHHLSRGLTRSRVLGIVANHGSTSIHSGRFYSGSVAFNNKFLDMWRYEGSPDYLAIDGSSATSDLSVEPPDAASPVNSGKGLVPVPLSPSKRLTSSAALFDERVVPNGAGRGREALDRLVRNAFIRNAMATTCTAPPSEKEDCVVPAVLATTVSDEREEKALSLVLPTDKFESKEESSAAQPPSDSGPSCPSPPRTTETSKPTLRSPLPLHSPDERALYESILLKGGVFKKYGQWGNPHRRFVWCPKEFDGVYWRPINKKHSLTKDGLAVSSLVAVVPGNSHRTRYAFMKHLSDEKSLSRCFSVVAEDRRLDLEADSEASRDLWIQALQFLIRQSPRRDG